MKKIIGLLIICACLVSCDDRVIIPLDGKIVSYKEYIRDPDMVVFKSDDGTLFEIKADDEAMDKYYYESKQHVRLSLLANKDTMFFENYGIQPIQ